MKIKQVKANMTELHLDSGTIVLFSYETPVAAHTNGRFIQTDKKYSQTTTRHINQWLDGFKAEVVSQSVIDTLVKG